MALEAGTLRVTLQYAKDIKDCDWFGRQDPYVRLRVGTQEHRSRMARDGGRNPVWDQTFEFSVINENTLDLTLMDEDTVVRDDLIGTCSVSLARVREQGVDSVQAPVSDGKKTHKQRGFVQLALAFTPNSRLRPTPSGYGVPYGAPYAPPPPAPAPPATAYGYPAQPAMSTCGSCAHTLPAAPYGYGYQPQYAQSYGPSPSYSYSHSFAAPPAPQQPPAPAALPAAPGAGWPTTYAAPAPSYYPPVPAPPPPVSASQPAYGGYAAGAPYYRS